MLELEVHIALKLDLFLGGHIVTVYVVVCNTVYNITVNNEAVHNVTVCNIVGSLSNTVLTALCSVWLPKPMRICPFAVFF